MRFIFPALGLASVLLAGSFSPAADEKKGTNQTPAKDAAKAKASPQAAAVQKLALAHNLIAYGRKNDAPEALITAARILDKIGTVEMKEKATREESKDAPKAAKKPQETDESPKALLAEAKKMSKDNPAIVALANSVELSRGAVGGPKQQAEVITPLATDSFRLSFRVGELACVAVAGNGDTRLDLYIYDEFGNLITSQVGAGDKCLASWVPKWTGTFTIRVVNRGLGYNRYGIATN